MSKITKTSLKSDFRDFKLRVLSDDVQFKPSKKFIEKCKEHLYFISDKFPDDIITGSLALKLFGLLNRDVGDVDIIIDDKDRYSNYKTGDYDDEVVAENRLGYIIFKHKRGIFRSDELYKVDFFHNYGASFTTFEFNGKQLKIHNPLEIIEHKINITSTSLYGRKHTNDLIFAFNQTFGN